MPPEEVIAIVPGEQVGPVEPDEVDEQDELPTADDVPDAQLPQVAAAVALKVLIRHDLHAAAMPTSSWYRPLNKPNKQKKRKEKVTHNGVGKKNKKT